MGLFDWLEEHQPSNKLLCGLFIALIILLVILLLVNKDTNEEGEEEFRPRRYSRSWRHPRGWRYPKGWGDRRRWGGYGRYYGYGWGLPYGVNGVDPWLDNYYIATPTYNYWDNAVQNADTTGCFSKLSAGVHLYYSDNCPACVKAKPVWKAVKKQLIDNVAFFEIDVNSDLNPCVKTIPTIIASNNGVTQKYEGNMDYKSLYNWIKQIYNL